MARVNKKNIHLKSPALDSGMIKQSKTFYTSYRQPDLPTTCDSLEELVDTYGNLYDLSQIIEWYHDARASWITSPTEIRFVCTVAYAYSSYNNLCIEVEWIRPCTEKENERRVALMAKKRKQWHADQEAKKKKARDDLNKILTQYPDLHDELI